MSRSLVILNLCYGSVRPMAISSCPNVYPVINKIIEVSRKFDRCYVINSEYLANSNIFKNIPPIFLKEGQDCLPLNEFFKQLHPKEKYLLNKNSLSCLTNKHNEELINSGGKNVYLAGFSKTFDIVPNALAFIEKGFKTTVIKDCIDDIGAKNFAVDDYLTFMNVKISHSDELDF